MLEFTPGITLNKLNPYDQRLGNDYLDNLLEIGIVLLPEIYKFIPDYRIVKAFTPKNRLEEDGVKLNWMSRKFTRGLGITFTYEDWDEIGNIALCKLLCENYNRYNHYIINNEKKEITILIKMRNRSIIEIHNGKKRTIL